MSNVLTWMASRRILAGFLPGTSGQERSEAHQHSSPWSLCVIFRMERPQRRYCGSFTSGLTPEISRTGRHALLQSRSPPPLSTTSLQLLRITSAAGRGTPKAFPKAFACSMSLVPFTRGWPGSAAVLTKLLFVMFVPAGAGIHASKTRACHSQCMWGA